VVSTGKFVGNVFSDPNEWDVNGKHLAASASGLRDNDDYFYGWRVYINLMPQALYLTSRSAIPIEMRGDSMRKNRGRSDTCDDDS
jgi:hypothetical protein